MNKKMVFYSATAVTVVAVGGYLVYKHLIPKAVEDYVSRQIAQEEWEESLLAQDSYPETPKGDEQSG
jgi:hypothetical protein